MFSFLRYLRHSSIIKKIIPWETLGKFYRLIIIIIPFNFSINQFVTKKINLNFMLYLPSVTSRIGVTSIMIFSIYVNYQKIQNVFLILEHT